MNLLQLSAIVSDKPASVRFLQQRNILHSSRRCPNDHDMSLSLSDRQDRWRCKRRECRIDIPLRRGTWLQNSNLPYRNVIIFVYCWSFEMTTKNFCERELDIGGHAFVDWSNFLREVCANTLINNPVVIGGPGMDVEIDESMFSRRKNEVGRTYPAQWVFGGICRQTKECFLFTVQDRSAATLEPIITQCILPGSRIFSDEWRSYLNISNLGQNYTHFSVNHSTNFVNPETGAHTQNIESLWNKAKRRNRKQAGTHRSLLDSYMCEFMWRCRCVRQNLNPFDAIMQDIAAFWPPS